MLDRLTPRPGSRRPRKRVGRGIGSGHGKTCGRGQKGAGARSGHRHRHHYEGGQLPLVQRVPKRGFTNIFRAESQIVNLRDLERFEGSEVNSATLAEAGLVRRASVPVKILGNGELKSKLQVSVQAVSAGARAKIEAAGGSVAIVPIRIREGGEQE
jgi:large subunit ribosomal protein L15